MDKNLVVSLNEIKGIRLQCKDCGSEVIFSPAIPYLPRTCPQGHPWQERPNDNNLSMFLEVWPESHWPGFALRQTDVL